MQSKASTVSAYLDSLPEDRRVLIASVRKVILESLGEGYEEGMSYGMIGYYVPHRVYPPGYHCDPSKPLPFAGLASQKGNCALYLTCFYGDADERAKFGKAWLARGKKLDMGKSCIRFKKLDDLALDVLASSLKRVTAKKFIARYEANLAALGRTPKAKAPAKATARVKPR